MFKKLKFYIYYYLNIRNIKLSLLVFFYTLLKKNTRYPQYLLNFEKKVSDYFGSKYALSFSNGTTACTALLYALGVKKNNKVIISKLTFPSIISSILRIGAIPIYLDFDKNLQIKFDTNNKLIQEADFILITHAYGITQDYDKINTIRKINSKIILIEDISHAQGAKNNNKLVGTEGLGSFMSMQGDKAISAGEGGVVITNSEEVYNRMFYLSHLNRKNLNNDKINSLSRIGLIGKGRMNPLGAISAISDIKNLKKRNNILIEKIKILYTELKYFEEIDIPVINNYNNLGGFHYGLPFFCYSEKIINKLKNNFNILGYNWPYLDLNENFQDPEKFLELIYKQDFKIDNIYGKSNDIRDNLYFFELKELMSLTKNEITKRMIISKIDDN
tara:strand:- start:10556 stop:11719 length:1164 start_codon:yes stop_codon:yes gene_type:complete